jgi:hypothetical protein
MCERCGESSFVSSAWVDVDDDDVDDDGAACDWTSGDDDEEMCPEPAAVAVYERRVDEHLCQECGGALEQELEDGFEDFSSDLGLGSSHELLPIRDDERCDRCSAPARLAWAVVAATYLCQAHAEERDVLPESE